MPQKNSDDYVGVLEICANQRIANRHMTSGLLIDGVVEEVKTSSNQIDELYQRRWADNRTLITNEARRVETAHVMRQIEHLMEFDTAETDVDEVLLTKLVPF